MFTLGILKTQMSIFQLIPQILKLIKCRKKCYQLDQYCHLPQILFQMSILNVMALSTREALTLICILSLA